MGDTALKMDLLFSKSLKERIKHDWFKWEQS